VLDEKSSKLIYNVVKEDEILDQRITSRIQKTTQEHGQPSDILPDIEQIEHRRPTNADVEAIYFLSPDPHIVDCLLADLGKKRYQGACLLWTSRE